MKLFDPNRPVRTIKAPRSRREVFWLTFAISFLIGFPIGWGISSLLGWVL